MSTNMLTVSCVTPGNLSLEQRERPVPGPGEVLLRVRRVGAVSYTHLTLPTKA